MAEHIKGNRKNEYNIGFLETEILVTKTNFNVMVAKSKMRWKIMLYY